jgi:heme/copper-type cytochrome/quinol oxidase subunit 2
MSPRSVLFWVAASCCVIAELAILRSVLFGRARTAEQHDNTSDGPRIARASRSVEIAWAVIPALGLLFVLYLTWRAVEEPRDSRTNVSHGGASIGV